MLASVGMDDTDPDDDRRATPDDLDRAAILARRQRFIALALSGLAGAAACTSTEREARPQACLKYSIEPRQKPERKPEPEPEPKPEPRADPEPADTAVPMPCLSPLPPDEPPTPPRPEPKATPAPCLSMVPTRPAAKADPKAEPKAEPDSAAKTPAGDG